MRLLVSGATDVMRQYAATDSDVLGCLAVPNAGNLPSSIAAIGLPIAADNGCFNGLDSDAFVRMLNAYREAGVKLEWVAVPDVVANADETFRLWGRWERIVTAFGFRPALVLQDGMTVGDVDIINPSVVFIGGTTRFKLGRDALRIVEWMKQKGNTVHMGRVNTRKRIQYAVRIGCDSCDGSGFSTWSRIRIPKGIRWIREAMAQHENEQRHLPMFAM